MTPTSRRRTGRGLDALDGAGVVPAARREVLDRTSAAVAEAVARAVAEEPRRGAASASGPTRRRQRWVGAGAVAAAVAASAALVVTAPWDVRGTPPDGVATGSGALREGGGSSGSCAQMYDLENLPDATFAFDGTVTATEVGGPLGDAYVTFAVEEWFRGGSGEQATALMTAPVRPGDTSFNSSQSSMPTYTVGTRLLVSGSSRRGEPGMVDPLVWGCGFTRYHDAATSAQWRAVLS